MSARAMCLFEEDDECADATVEVDMAAEEAHWRDCWRREAYVRPGRSYEDYAPAYCVGYIGHAQYGGDFGEAEKSLCANWVRIRGDSPLAWDEALDAMRAAWDRMADAGRSRRPALVRAALASMPVRALPRPSVLAAA